MAGAASLSEISLALGADGGIVTVDDLWDYVMLTEPPPERSSQERYERAWRLHIAPYLGAVRIEEVTPPMVKQWLVKLRAKGFRTGSGARTIEQSRAILSRLFAVAVEDGLVAASPVTRGSKRVLPPQDRRSPVILTLRQVEAIASHMDREGDRVLVRLLAWGGVRLGEPAALRVRSFDGTRIVVSESVKGSGHVWIGSTKTDRVRRVPLPSSLAGDVEALCAGRHPDAFIFTSPTGKMLNPRNWRRRVFTPAVHAAGMPGVRPHDLRHTAATLWSEAGVPDFARREMLGHTTDRMTEHYTHLTEAAETAAIAVLDVYAGAKLETP